MYDFNIPGNISTTITSLKYLERPTIKTCLFTNSHSFFFLLALFSRRKYRSRGHRARFEILRAFENVIAKSALSVDDNCGAACAMAQMVCFLRGYIAKVGAQEADT